MPPVVRRHPANPILQPGRLPWRLATVFNPGVVEHDGRVLLIERAAGQLRPFHCYFGALASDDGVRFEHLSDEPVFSPAAAGSEHGSVQDPRLVSVDGRLLMTYAFRPYAWCSHPTGVGVPESFEPTFEGFSGNPLENQTRSGLAVSTDGVNWRHDRWLTPAELDDRDVILFPERIAGRWAMLRRPLQFVGRGYGTERAGIWVTLSDDLEQWDPPTLLAGPTFWWETGRIGGSIPPVRVDEGWLVLYHGVEERDRRRRDVIYRVGAMLLDGDDPRRVIARAPEPFFEPETYYERFGLYIPNVVFPTGHLVRDGELWLYYGVCDTAIALGIVDLRELVEWVVRTGR